ncbi:MAG: hypothetical protein GC153_06680 [Alphaproteobacteria bacterium]|nr:hypothetical protein [Alphaproteobacteria bacterium]
MNTRARDRFAYCDDLVRRRDEDRWLSARYAPPAARRRLISLYALHQEIAAAPARVSEPALGEMRLQWWREAIDEARSPAKTRAHPVLTAIDIADSVDNQTRLDLDAAIEARARLLYEAGFDSIVALASWARACEAYLAPAAARLLGEKDPRFDGPLREAASAYALARCAETLAPALAAAAKDRARTQHEAAAKALAGLSAEACPAALHFALTPLYAARTGGPSALEKRWRIFRAMATGRF